VFKAINAKFLREAGGTVLKATKDNIERKHITDLGGLKGSYHFKVSGDQVSIGTNLKYAPYVEYGTGIYAESGNGRKTPWSYFSKKYGWVTTRGMVARPHLRPALDNNRKFLVALWADTYNKVFRVLGGK
jgi:phage gpG-like protein